MPPGTTAMDVLKYILVVLFYYGFLLIYCYYHLLGVRVLGAVLGTETTVWKKPWFLVSRTFKWRRARTRVHTHTLSVVGFGWCSTRWSHWRERLGALSFPLNAPRSFHHLNEHPVPVLWTHHPSSNQALIEHFALQWRPVALIRTRLRFLP